MNTYKLFLNEVGFFFLVHSQQIQSIDLLGPKISSLFHIRLIFCGALCCQIGWKKDDNFLNEIKDWQRWRCKNARVLLEKCLPLVKKLIEKLKHLKQNILVLKLIFLTFCWKYLRKLFTNFAILQSPYSILASSFLNYSQ